MRSARTVAFIAVPLAFAAPAAAQNPECAGVPTLEDARETCNVAVDFARAYHPIAGLAISGGNPVIGSGGASGHLGSFSVTLRSNLVPVSVPDLSNAGSGGSIPQDDEILAPAPLIEGHAGLFRGLPGGLFAVDLLAALQLVPNEDISEEIRVDPDAPSIGPVSLGTGIGVRVGVLPDDGPLPGVSVSFMYRSIPRVGFGDLAAGDDVAADVRITSTNLRLTAGKKFAVLAVAGGLGWSRYAGDATARYDAGLAGAQTIALELRQSRMLYFLNAGLDFGLVKLVGEVGRQSGKDQGLGTEFTGFDDTEGTTFYSVGLRMGI
ncbi:MAG TPA: hypothetical protein VFT04_06740 [Gemmatimonadales bacterium]|nr:hypothetical protein [Gemmatimonadales bacterium]